MPVGLLEHDILGNAQYVTFQVQLLYYSKNHENLQAINE